MSASSPTSATPENVRGELTRTMKARWRKGFPSAREFTPARFMIGREGNEWYAYEAGLGFFFAHTTPQLVINAVRTEMTNRGLNGTIHINDGTITNANFILDRDNTVLEGEGWQSFIDGGTQGHGVVITGDGCTVRNLGIRTTAGGGTAYVPIVISGGGNALIDRVWVWGSDNEGIRVEGTYAVIDRCYIHSTDTHGIWVGATNCRITNSTIGSSTSGHLIYCDGGAGGVVVSNNALVYVPANFDGVFLHSGCNAAIVEHNFISAMAAWSTTTEPVDDNTSANVALVYDNNAGGNVCNSKGCCFGTIGQAITHLASAGGFVEVPVGVFSEQVNINEAGITLRGRGNASVIIFNTSGNGGYAIWVHSGAHFTNIRDLQVATLTSGTDAIRFSGVNFCRVYNVEIDEAVRDGISAIGSDNLIVEESQVTFCTRNGILLSGGCSGAIVGKNFIELCSGHAVQVADGGGIIINSNFIDRTWDDGILLSGSDNTVVGNRIANWTNEAVDDNSVGSTVANNTIG